MPTLLRPWIEGKLAKTICVEGDRVDVKWKDGITSGHDYALRKGEPGFILNNHDTLVWVPMSLVQFRKIPLAKKSARF